MSNEIEEAAEKARNCGLLPEKSKQLYEKCFNEYVKWCKLRNDSIENYHCEKTLLAYFWDISKEKKPSSLWSYYSMLKATIKANYNVDISKYSTLFGFLKRKSDGFKPKKSKVLTMEQIETFLYQAPDEIHLLNKVALIFGIAGACRKQELTQLEIHDIQDLTSSLLITLRDTKNKSNRMFSVIDNQKSPILIEIYKKYAVLRPSDIVTRRFFLSYRNGKCTRQVVGKNTFGSIPKQIANFLNLANPELYTGHSFRRSAATLLANAGEGIIGIKQIGGWKSTSVAEQYIEDSVSNKNRLAEKIFFSKDNSSKSSDINVGSSTSKSVVDVSVSKSTLISNQSSSAAIADVRIPNFNMNNCNNCIVNIYNAK